MQEIAFGAFFQTKKCKSEKMHEVVHFYLKKNARKWGGIEKGELSYRLISLFVSKKLLFNLV
jgi:hypothetical protein